MIPDELSSVWKKGRIKAAKHMYRMIYFFLLSLFYISTTTRHTLENRRFLEANSNEKFCGTIRETLCECAAPSSMESYIYNIACLCVSHICCVCTCLYVYFHMFARVWSLCMCLGVLRYSCVFSLVFSLAFFHSRVLSLFSLIHCSFTLVLSRFSRTLSHLCVHTFFPARLSLPPYLAS